MKMTPEMTAPACKTDRTWRRSSAKAAIAAERDAAIAYWIAQMPEASNMRISGYTGASPRYIRQWRKTQAGRLQPGAARSIAQEG
jgi:hypothetical protein